MKSITNLWVYKSEFTINSCNEFNTNTLRFG